jgi:hypothetical protein
MLHAVKSRVALLVVGGFTLLAGCIAAPPPAPPPARHPAYLHSLSDLRAARWLIGHRASDDWAQSADESESVRQIDAAINDIKQAAIDDGKNLNDHPPIDTHIDHRGRIHQALDNLRRARADIAREEDNGYAHGLRNRAIGHIDGSINAARRVFSD